MRTLILAVGLLASGAALAQTVPPSTAPTDTRQSNPPVATSTTTNDSTAPAPGANSFTEGQAKSRMEERGYTKVTDLQKDRDGIWRGSAAREGRSVQVWLDYKGNIGER